MGVGLSLRAIAPGDAEALRRGFARLTPEQARLRTFHRIAELSPEMTERLTNVDPATTTALVVVDADGEIRGDARLHVDATTDSAEFGIAVDPDYTNQGIGWRLMQRLFEDAKRRGLYELWGDVLAENHTMLDFAKAMGAERRIRSRMSRVSFASRFASPSCSFSRLRETKRQDCRFARRSRPKGERHGWRE